MATSIIRLHAFSGTNENDPPCYLLQVDDFHCLLDCGWDSNFSDTYVQQISKYTKIIDAVFISHSDIHHMGALPYLVGTCGLNCPVYTTYPVSKMGQLSLYDAYLSKAPTDDDFDQFTLDDVDNAFDLIVPMKYHQEKKLHGKGQGLTIVPYLSGHMLGGAIWQITKDDMVIVYALDYNHNRELHLNGAVFENIRKAHLLITGSYGSSQKNQRRQREENLRNTIQATLREGGNVIFLSDTAGRSLELSYLLEQLWHDKNSSLMPYGLANLSRVAHNVNEFAKSNVEWMSDKVIQSFEEQRSKPFDFRYTRLCHNIEDLSEVSDPKVIVVSQSHLNYGFGRELFTKFCTDKKNQFIITSRSREKCLTSELFQHIADKNSKSNEPFTVTIKERAKQNNADLYLKITPEIAMSAESALRSQSMKNSAIDTVDDGNISDDEEKDDKMDWDDAMPDQMQVMQDSVFDMHDLPGSLSSEVNGIHFRSCDIYPSLHANSGGQWFRSHKRMHLMFPSHESKNQWDEYGEPINVKDPNFLYTPGSSHANNAMNKVLLMRDACMNNNIGGTINSGSMGTCSSVVAKNTKRILNEQSLALMTNNFIKKRDEQASKPMMTREIAVNCSLIYHNFEGLSDSSSMNQTIINCKPQEIIIVGGSKEDSANMATFCKSNLQMSDNVIHIPDNGQVINCTKECHIYQTRMSDALVSGLAFNKVGNYELSWLEAVIKVSGTGAATISAIAAGDDITSGNGTNGGSGASNGGEIDELAEANGIPSLEPPEGPIPEHNTIFINEPKLSDLKQILMRDGHNAEFMGGTLVIDNCVAIKRSEAGKLLLEGVAGKKYYQVRKLLYSQFAIL